jgi:hypothetical protein
MTAVHYTRDETQLLCHAAPVLPDVVSAGCGVPVHEFADIAGLSKDVGGVPQLRDFGDDRARQLLSREFWICARSFFFARWPLTLRMMVRFGVLAADGGRAQPDWS